MKINVKKTVSVASCAAIAALFIVLMFFCVPKIPALPQTSGSLIEPKWEDGAVKFNEYVVGEDLTATRVSELGELGAITKVNYVPDKFVKLSTITEDMQTVDLTKPFEFAEKGSLVFVIMNLDPDDELFDEKSEKLNAYKVGDYWQFTLHIPKIFGASNIYRRAELVARHGEIEGYDFIDFNTSYDKKTDRFTQQAESTAITLNFYTRRETMANSYNAAQIITVHYQSAGSAFSGIKECPLVGSEKAVTAVTERSNTLLISFAIITTVVFAILAMISLLKRTRKYVSDITWLFGITLLLFSRFFLAQSTAVPLMWTGFWLASSFIVAGGALLATGANFGKLPAKYIFTSLAALGGLLAFIRPFVPFGAAVGLEVTCTAIKCVCALALVGFIVFNALRRGDSDGIMRSVCTTLIAVALTASVFLPQIYPAQSNPVFWLCVATTAATFVSVFLLFNETEKANAHLTSNLHLEVDRQLKDIRSVISERDDLLRFVSHDMQKPLQAAGSLLDTLIDREKDKEQTKGLQIVKQHTERVVSNLSEIGAYAKFNYIAEPSQVVDLCKMCGELYEFHLPDCNANGIVLQNLAEKSVKAFVKKQGLENVLSNLIINAVEHASCKTISLSVKQDKNKVVLCVADDGKGIDAGLDVFKPYASENDDESGGVGLYICKSIIESMNGELYYESGQGGTTFFISLLKA